MALCENCNAEIKRATKVDLDSIYRMYPRKQGKTPGMRKLQKQKWTQERFELLKAAVIRYRNYCEEENKDAQYVMLFSTFVNQWEDWAEEGAGTCDLTATGGIESSLRLLEKEIG